MTQKRTDFSGFIDPPASVAAVFQQRFGIRFRFRRCTVEQVLIAAPKRFPQKNREVACRWQHLGQAAAVGGHDVLIALDALRRKKVREAPTVPVEQRQTALATLFDAG